MLPIQTTHRDAKGRAIWQKWCAICEKPQLARFEHVNKLCRSCVKKEGKGFPPGTLIDPEFEYLATWSWRIINSGYVYNTIFGLLHRFVTKAPAGKVVDHLNKNKLDCRRANLEVISPRENACRRDGRIYRNNVDFF